MQYSDTLLTLAEVGVAFAGFSGLAAIITGARSAVDPRAHHVRFRGMIESALLVVVFSVAPLVLSPLGFAEATTWRTASGLLGIVLIADISSLISRIRALETSSFSLTVSVVLLGLLALSAGLLLLNAGGLFVNGGAVYLLSLFLLLVVSASLFLRLLMAFVPHTRE
jgi:hypothetical protein